MLSYVNYIWGPEKTKSVDDRAFFLMLLSYIDIDVDAF